MPPAGPSKIGKYDVEERVGEGAMGVVYRAIDPVLKRRVAIKVMSDAFAQNDDLRERFLREAQAAGSLQHPNVITIYDFGEVDGHPYIAMEFVEGQDVAELLAHQVPLSLADKLDLAIGLLQGLAFAHKRGIVHRDIKPANIRVDGEGKARIMDFGVAHLASSEMTKSGVMLGTPSYMAPEQIVGGKVGPQADIFSAGAVLYELLTGARPFQGDTLHAVMYRVLNGAPTPLAAAAPGLPARLDEVVQRALAKEPPNRYANALDMANDLIAIRAAVDATSKSPPTLSLRATIETALEGRRTREVRRVRNRRALIVAGVALSATSLVLSGWLIARRGVAAPAAAPAPTAQPNVSPAGVASSVNAAAADSLVRPQTPPNSSSQPATQAKRPSPQQSPARTRQAPAGSPTTTDGAGMPQPPVDRRATTAGSTTAKESIATVTPPVTAPSTQTTPATATATNTAPPIANPRPSVPPPDVRPFAGTATPPGSAAGAPQAPAPPVVSPAANATAEIAVVIDTYAKAIESRDMTELRRVYAAITPEQARAFSDFFSSTRTLKAALSVKNVHVDGGSATASVGGVYEFTTSGGRTQQQAVNFQTELRREQTGWKLVAVR